MNCKQAKKIKLETILSRLGYQPTKRKKRGRELWYLSPFRKEKTPSFKILTTKNIFFDHGENKGGNVLDFIMEYHRCELKEALVLMDRDFSSFDQQNFKNGADENKENIFRGKLNGKRKAEKNWKIQKIHRIKHPALITYIKKRKVYQQRKELKEIHYQVNKKPYFGVGFQNDSGGWEIRNKYAKICLGNKEISTRENESETLRIFEGFFDYFSFLQLEKSLGKSTSDYIVLNSISLVHRLEKKLKNYEKIELYLDNDSSGNLTTKTIKKMTKKEVEDGRILYPNAEDLNEFIQGK